MDKLMAYTRIMLSHRGSVKRDSLEDNAFMALSISMTTRLYNAVSGDALHMGAEIYIDNETVEADLALSFVNIWQPISGN